MFEQPMMTPATFSIAPVDDEALARRVRQALGEIKPLDRLGAPLYVQVRDGLVTLRGVVATQRIKAQILQVARSVPCVRQVYEELWV